MHCCFVHKGTMGNIVQCCHTLSNYFKCEDVPARGEPERSPLLSSEDSECDSSSLPDDLEEDLLTISTGVTNPTLEPENFLFPDIILSSNLGGDVTLVEPMVCLLVSEEEEGVRVDERVGEGQERSYRGSNRGYSEVETQTEVETQIGMGVQTQTELQAHSEILVCHSETVEREVNTPANTGTTNEVVVDVWGKHEILRQVDVLLDVQTDTQTSQEKLDSETWSVNDGCVELEVPGKVERLAEKNKVALRAIDKEAEQELKESHILEELTATLTKHTFQTAQNTELNTEDALKLQQNTDFACAEHCTLQTQENVKDRGQSVESERTSVMLTEHKVNNMDENIAAVDSQRNVKLPKHSNTETVVNFDPAECVDLTRQSDQGNGQVGQETGPPGPNGNGKDPNVVQTKSNINLSEDHTDQTADQSTLNEDHIQRQEKWHPPKRRTALRQEEEEEEGAEVKHMTLFSVDRLFLAGARVKGAWFYLTAFIFTCTLSVCVIRPYCEASC